MRSRRWCAVAPRAWGAAISAGGGHLRRTQPRARMAAHSSQDEVNRSAAVTDAVLLPLGEEPPEGFVTLWPANGRTRSRRGRVVQLSRHELAVAFRGAQLRETLDRERQELTAIVDGATDAIIQVDEDCRIVRINPAARQLLGLSSDGGTGRPCSEVLRCVEAGAHAEDACPLAEVIQSGRPIAYREAAVLDGSGAVICVAGGYSRAASEPGGRIRATAILRDISAVRALEQLREGFVATISHELRTPLALIRGLHGHPSPSGARARRAAALPRTN